MKGMKNILMIGAHYDDVELGCGGTAAKLAEEGKNVYKLTLTDNATDFKQMNIHVDADASIHESASSCQILGIREITEFKPVPCNHLFYSTELMQRVESVIFDCVCLGELLLLGSSLLLVCHYCHLLSLKLLFFNKLGKYTVLFNKLVICACFCDLTFIDNNYPVAVFYSRKSMSDHNACAFELIERI